MNQQVNGKILPWLPALLLFFFLVLGCGVFSDYGFSWDEDFSYRESGHATWGYIATGDFEGYNRNSEKYHGPAFELTLVALEKLAAPADFRSAILLRHFFTFFLYWISGLAIWLHFRSKKSPPIVQLFAVAWYFLMPRIFADSFYNSKDIPFLALFALNTVALFRFADKPARLRAILFGLACGYMIAIRILGLLVPLVTTAVIMLRLTRENKRHSLQGLVAFLLSCAAGTLLFWPILWDGPIHHLTAAWKEMQQYYWPMTVLFRGTYIEADQLPWYYAPWWIAMTTPVYYLLLAGVALAGVIKSMASRGSAHRKKHTETIICVILLGMPLLSVIFFGSTLYDGWRHLYFVFTPLLVLALYGFEQACQWLRRPGLQKLFASVLLAATLHTAYQMYRYHPFEHVYFNSLLGPDPAGAENQYDLDYWGLSYRQALEKLARATSPDSISLKVANAPGYHNAIFLSADDRERIRYTSEPDSADYYITNFRWDQEIQMGYPCIDSIQAGPYKISGTYKLR